MTERISLDDRQAAGAAARTRTPRSAHAGWKPAAGRPSPVTLLAEQNTGREPDLVPVRHGRMLVSPFTFYRGAARVMAADLKDTPRSGLNVQLCGAVRTAKGGGKKSAREAAKQARRTERQLQQGRARARSRDSLQALSKLGELDGGRYRIASQPPLVIPARDLAPRVSAEQVGQLIAEQFTAYRASLPDDMRHLLGQFEVADVARKVVGVGSVGTLCFIVLLIGRDLDDPLFLQVKEAGASVLEEHLPKSRYRQHGRRVVQGQRLTQAASDIYLGWTGAAGDSRHFYWRQLRDMKGSAVVEDMTPLSLSMYAGGCGWTLARAHARSGDPVAIAAYLGSGDAFGQSLLDFAVRYADQNERDYAEFAAAVRSGRLTAVEGV